MISRGSWPTIRVDHPTRPALHRQRLTTTVHHELSTPRPLASDRKQPTTSQGETKLYSATGNRTPVSRVTGGDTSHYTIAEI